MPQLIAQPFDLHLKIHALKYRFAPS
jgi:hypothetical protein